MDFVDWRKSAQTHKVGEEAVAKQPGRYYGGRYYDHVERIIRDAQERGEFSNLEGMGKPLRLEDEHATGDNALGYHMLKQHGYAPPEVELSREIRTEQERLQAKLAKVHLRYERLRARRVPPFPSEKRAFNNTVKRTAHGYEKALRKLNSRILTLNLTAPYAMHQPLLRVEELVQQFRDSCPLLDE
jgi:DnaJ family protein C protein 28